ncbi:MAG: SDR family oxidoreductase [Kineosporiaceae bacterium]|nr:SDR family oxidoreductase [Kineosporiaceae bacterium]
MTTQLRAVVTGASSGIGAATVRALRASGWSVLAVARRADRLEALAAETGCEPCVADVTDPDDVARVVRAAGPTLNALVNNAGGALGAETVDAARIEDWATMFEVNTLGALRLTQALLPALRASGRGDVLFLTSTAAMVTYPGGAGYSAAKHAEGALARTLRLELVGEPIRVIEIAPGMVKTEEFALNRNRGDAAKAAAVYAGVREPLTAQDVAGCIDWALNLPHHVNIDLLVVRPRAQAAQHLVARDNA